MYATAKFSFSFYFILPRKLVFLANTSYLFSIQKIGKIIAIIAQLNIIGMIFFMLTEF